MREEVVMGMGGLQVLHDSPGRLRLAMGTRPGAKAQAAACAETLRTVPGVRDVQANPLTGSILVLYTPAAPTRQKIQELCLAWAGEDPVSQPPQEKQPGHHGHGLVQAGSMALLAELAPHLLRLVLGSCPICRGR